MNLLNDPAHHLLVDHRPFEGCFEAEAHGINYDVEQGSGVSSCLDKVDGCVGHNSFGIGTKNNELKGCDDHRFFQECMQRSIKTVLSDSYPSMQNTINVVSNREACAVSNQGVAQKLMPSFLESHIKPAIIFSYRTQPAKMSISPMGTSLVMFCLFSAEAEKTAART